MGRQTIDSARSESLSQRDFGSCSSQQYHRAIRQTMRSSLLALLFARSLTVVANTQALRRIGFPGDPLCKFRNIHTNLDAAIDATGRVEVIEFATGTFRAQDSPLNNKNVFVFRGRGARIRQHRFARFPSAGHIQLRCAVRRTQIDHRRHGRRSRTDRTPVSYRFELSMTTKGNTASVVD